CFWFIFLVALLHGPAVEMGYLTICPSVSTGVDNDREPEQTEVPSMLLRDHPLNSRHGVPNWHPVGIWIGELENTHPKAFSSRQYLLVIQPVDRFFLCVDYEDSAYIGCLLFNDYALCQQAAEHFFQFCCKHSIADVGLASSFPCYCGY